MPTHGHAVLRVSNLCLVEILMSHIRCLSVSRITCMCPCLWLQVLAEYNLQLCACSKRDFCVPVFLYTLRGDTHPSPFETPPTPSVFLTKNSSRLFQAVRKWTKTCLPPHRRRKPHEDALGGLNTKKIKFISWSLPFKSSLKPPLKLPFSFSSKLPWSRRKDMNKSAHTPQAGESHTKTL